MRKVISDMLNQEECISVVGTARNGQDAIDKIKVLQPHVITLDVEMPVMDGLETLKIIMVENPLPVVMVSSTTVDGAKNTLLAIEYGAVDFVAKTSGAISLDLHKVKEELVEKVILASSVKMQNVFPNKNKPLQNIIKSKTQEEMTKSPLSLTKKIVAIGTSTGGPKALQQVLTKLPKSLQAPIVIVQHMPAGFTNSLANRLNTLSDIAVKEAVDGEILKNGVAYIAPGGFHLTIVKMGASMVIHIDKSPPRKGHRPSVDVMFESLSLVRDFKMIAVIMTGMGADGTEGLMKLKSKTNCYAIAESEETAIVYGMPKSAINTNSVDEVVPLQNIAKSIINKCLN
ncbi:protein-glutamate methylesterase/protein-glutamine glutaminase [Bacillus sp. FJAT-45350]|uniref:protein-glutamate methylesterase/protein-glutamine glutaminase n=1 Tax=Bacillus sp. FJAT-45350 TaxID=2011014 RepID=UPI00359CA09F